MKTGRKITENYFGVLLCGVWTFSRLRVFRISLNRTKHKQHPHMNLSKEEQEEAVKLLKHSPMLRHCTEEQLKQVVKHMKKNVYSNGTILAKEGDPMQKMYILRRGQVRREKELDGAVHHIDTQLSGYTVGSLHIMNKDPAYATSKCVGDVEAFELSADDFNQLFVKNPQFAWNVAYSLSREVRRHTKLQRTPLLEQKSKPIPVVAVSIAASIESFYRAALNAFLNQKLTGKKMDKLFPNMHVQVPTRIMYINGFKGIRWYLDNHIKPEQYSNPTAVRLAAAITPGLCMSPISSILEACNAGHSNPKPLYLRWIDGFIPRAGREVIFGVGLNQLSDWCEERVPYFKNPALVNAIGSLSAGLMSGYMSHVVHNLSTLKLMDPTKSYKQHFLEYVKKSEARLPVANMSPSARFAGSVAMACLFPAGCLIRITQIAGSFIILNGSINAMQRYIKA